MSLIIKPPTPLPSSIDRPAVFLAGSIEMGNADNWQARVEQALENTSVAIFNPRREQWDASWEQSIENPMFRQQVEWELDALEMSDLILMYFDPNTKAPITLLELGLFARSHELLLCCPPGFWRRGNVEVVCQRFGIVLFDSFEPWLHHAKQRVKQMP